MSTQQYSPGFFDYLGMAHMERVHSQMLAWLFSPDFTGIEDLQRQAMLQKIFNLSTNEKIIRSETERDKIDILIETETRIIAIENKFQTQEHNEQFTRYPETDAIKKSRKTPFFFYLTLTPELNIPKTWKNINYKEVLDGLRLLRLENGNRHATILEEYIDYLGGLTSSISQFEARPQSFAFVFEDGKKKKQDKVGVDLGDDVKNFIAKNQLETILQKNYLSKVMRGISPAISYKIGDTGGDAYCDLHLINDIPCSSEKFDIFLQLQNNALRFSFSVKPRVIIKGAKSKGKPATPNKKIVMKAFGVFADFFKTPKFPYKRSNRAIKKGSKYISASYIMNPLYYEVGLPKLQTALQNDIANAIVIAKALEKELKKAFSR